jgi:hypothetical protein
VLEGIGLQVAVVQCLVGADGTAQHDQLYIQALGLGGLGHFGPQLFTDAATDAHAHALGRLGGRKLQPGGGAGAQQGGQVPRREVREKWIMEGSLRTRGSPSPGISAG